MGKHSQTILNQLYEYDSFLDSLTSIVDMGCGTGEDIAWWATLTTRDEPPIPHNYRCYAIDKDASKLAQVPDLPNIHKLNRDFTKLCLPVKVDFIWAHDSLQYSHNPLETLKLWNEQMNVNGMMVISVPMDSGLEYNRYYNRTHSGCYFHYSPTNLIYMLAVNGFDCRDAYLLKKINDPWVHIAVYKSTVAPMNPGSTTWADLLETGLLHPSVVNSISEYGHLRQEDILYPWLDRENYFVDYVSQATEIPKEAGPPRITGVFNKTTEAKDFKVKQADPVAAETKMFEPVGVMRPSKNRYVK